MKKMPLNKRTISLLAILLPVFSVFIYVVVSSGPLAPILITVKEIENQSIRPSIFGIGNVEAKYRYRVSPTITGRVLQLNVHVGDQVSAGQILGLIDPVDLDNKITAKDAAIKKAKAALNVARAQVLESDARNSYAKSQSDRHEQLSKNGSVSKESYDAKYQEYQIAKAGVMAKKASEDAAKAELAVLRADYSGLLQQRSNLQLLAPVSGLIVGRYIEPGSTAAAAQTVIELIDPESLWINVRFNQLHASGLVKNLPVKIVLHSRPNQYYSGRIDRVEPLADAVTEEILAKVIFDEIPENAPSVGELSEVTVLLSATKFLPVVPNASIKLINGQIGVWHINNDQLEFISIKTGVSDLDGNVQVLEGLKAGDKVVVYSLKELKRNSRFKIVDRILESSQ
jgi:RND family efflux transporter MFP subunit